VILELTAAGSDPVRNYYQLHHALRATLLIASRPSGRPNGRVVVTLTPPSSTNMAIPAEPDLQRILSHIWGLKATAPSQPDFVTRSARAIEIPRGNGDDARYTP
jgi:hypothetical protein